MSMLNPGLSKPVSRAVPIAVRLLTLALLVGGLLGGITNLIFVPPGFWVWEMPALALRFLAAAAFAYVAGSLVTFSRSRWIESELLISTVNFYGWPLLLAILIDNAQIDWGKPMSWAFVAVVAPALAISVPYLFINRRRVTNEPRFPLNNLFKAFLGILGLAALAVGLLVFIVPKQAGLLWPWAELTAWKQLDSRLIASMLLTVGAAAFMVIWRNDRGAAGVFMAMLAAYCVVAGLGVGLHAAATPAFVTQDLIYIGIFGVVLVAGLLLYLLPGPRGYFNSASNRRG